MKYLSVCSGIEAATVAWHPLGWEAAAYSEIEKFPSAVLAHHYPTVLNFGDMTKFKEWDLDSIDLLVGGTPCQSFSVAGLRKGLEDPRGNLALVYCGILDRFRPQWFVWENVPGVLSSNGGRDFGSFLGALAELGYGFAYRVLDAQYFGVAQRRRRVFVVGYFGDWRPAAEVLFEPESVRGDPAPSRGEREKVAGCATPSVAKCLITRTRLDSETENFIALAENTIGRQPQNGGNHDGFSEGGPMYTLNATGVHGVAHPVYMGNAEGGAKEVPFLTCQNLGLGISNQTPLVGQPMAYNIAPGKGLLKDDIHVTYADTTKTLDASGSNPSMHQGGAAIVQPISFSGQMSVPSTGVDMTPTLQAKNPMAMAYSFDSISSNSMKSKNPDSGCNQVDVSKTLDTSRGLDPSCNQGGIAIAQPIGIFQDSEYGIAEYDTAKTLRAGRIPAHQMAIQQMAVRRLSPKVIEQPIAFSRNDDGRDATYDLAPTMRVAGNAGGMLGIATVMQVRRLTPVECERLQGFPDGYTNIPWRKAAESPDGPRYKALGNSMAVPVMAWIGRRINDYEKTKISVDGLN